MMTLPSFEFPGRISFIAKKSIFMGLLLQFKFRVRFFTIRTVYWPKLDLTHNQWISQCNISRLVNTRSNLPRFSRSHWWTWALSKRKWELKYCYSNLSGPWGLWACKISLKLKTYSRQKSRSTRNRISGVTLLKIYHFYHLLEDD